MGLTLLFTGQVALGGVTYSLTFFGSMMAGAIGGFAGGLVATGSLKGAMIGAFTGAAAGAVGGLFRMEGVSDFFGRFTETARAMAHGITGGAAAEMSGASFSSGFLAGSFGSLAGSYGYDWGNVAANTLQAAVVGGTASVIGGGKFENGAVTAAFQHLFNHEVDKGIRRSQMGKVSGSEIYHLNKSKAAKGQGHAATLIGKEGEYVFYSYGDNSKHILNLKRFDAFSDAWDFVKGEGYDRYIRWDITTVEANLGIREAWNSYKQIGDSYGQKYIVTSSNCMRHAYDVLHATIGHREYLYTGMNQVNPNVFYKAMTSDKLDAGLDWGGIE
jgi:hypothetical protein